MAQCNLPFADQPDYVIGCENASSWESDSRCALLQSCHQQENVYSIPAARERAEESASPRDIALLWTEKLLHLDQLSHLELTSVQRLRIWWLCAIRCSFPSLIHLHTALTWSAPTAKPGIFSVKVDGKPLLPEDMKARQDRLFMSGSLQKFHDGAVCSALAECSNEALCCG